MKIALIQLNAGSDKKKNLDAALRLTCEAIRNKARFILLPEVFNYRGKPDAQNGFHSIAENIPGPSTEPLMILARANRVFILAGSIYEKVTGEKKVYNTSVLINDKGKIAARYRKIHLFDARLGKKIIREPQFFLSGKNPVTASVGGFKAGLSICYDLRFPDLYKHYAKAGAQILCVPSSFTATTGEAHWEILLRARAIENLCYILAPNQFGKTPAGIETYGNSMVVDPWGKILARASGANTSGARQEILYADIDKKTLLESRKKLPGIAEPTQRVRF